MDLEVRGEHWAQSKKNNILRKFILDFYSMYRYMLKLTAEFNSVHLIGIVPGSSK